MSDAAVPLPSGFRAGSAAAGIKRSGGPDLVAIVSEWPATYAATFTRNRVTAAPVKLCRERLSSGLAMRAVVINSGNANCCTGADGLYKARRTAEIAAEALDCRAEEVLVCSTGSIGIPLPLAPVENILPGLLRAAHCGGGAEAALGILTTDTVPKTETRTLRIGTDEVRITALCKGAGMIRPDMATMLCYILTDAAVEQGDAQAALLRAVQTSFNRITVDADMSTNDTVMLLANGAAGAATLNSSHPDWKQFENALCEIALALALKIVDDGEGAERRANITVCGAIDNNQADRAARAVADSLLVKTGWAGGRPAWGRVMDALGYCGVEMDELLVDIDYGGIPTVRAGVSAGADPEALREVLARAVFDLDIDLNIGEGQAVIYTCDCTEAYVRINMV